MKQFFYILFGGLFAVFVGVSVTYLGSLAWKVIVPQTHNLRSISAMASSAISQAVDGTSVSGIKRSIRYTADEEEDLINAASLALPSGADGKITAGAYLVADLDTGQIVANYNADRILPIASLTKLVTAEVEKKLLDEDSKITLTSAVMSTYGNTAGFRIGETFTASDLLYPLLMVSSNDAAEAYAQYYGRAKFIHAMNEFAQSIGAYKTYFADPSGLSPKNVSSASDIALILDYVRKNDPETFKITGLKAKTIRSHTWVNPTHFLNWSNYLGGKNGYTDEADRTGAALFTLGALKDTYAVVVLGSETRDPDVIKLLAKVK